MNNEIPRRAYLDKLTPEELAIHNVIQQVEALGAHPLLTDTIVLLADAKRKLADWVDLRPTACALGNHYVNDGQGRDFDFCPDCGAKL